MEQRTKGGKDQAKCTRCGKWANTGPDGDWYYRDGGTRLYQHVPCEIARSVASKKANAKGSAKPKAAAKKSSAKKSAAKRKGGKR